MSKFWWFLTTSINHQFYSRRLVQLVFLVTYCVHCVMQFRKRCSAASMLFWYLFLARSEDTKRIAKKSIGRCRAVWLASESSIAVGPPFEFRLYKWCGYAYATYGDNIRSAVLFNCHAHVNGSKQLANAASHDAVHKATSSLSVRIQLFISASVPARIAACIRFEQGCQDLYHFFSFDSYLSLFVFAASLFSFVCVFLLTFFSSTFFTSFRLLLFNLTCFLLFNTTQLRWHWHCSSHMYGWRVCMISQRLKWKTKLWLSCIRAVVINILYIAFTKRSSSSSSS